MKGFETLFKTRERILYFFGSLTAPFILIPAIHRFHFSIIPDDSYYYYQIARVFNETGKISFDGISAATGFHPLFFAVCAFLYRFTGDALPYAIPFLSLALFCLFVFFAVRITAQLDLTKGQSVLFGFSFIANPALIAYGWWNGLETILLFPFYTLFLSICLSSTINGDNSGYRAANAMTVLLFFIRIDSIFLTFPVLLYVYRSRLRAAWHYFLALPLTVAAFCTAHHYLFGSFLPSSSDSVRLLLQPSFQDFHHIFSTGYYIDYPDHIIYTVRHILVSIGYFLGLTHLNSGKAFSMILAAGAVSYLLAAHFLSPSFRSKKAGMAVVMLVSVLFLIYINTVRMFYLRFWYHATYALVFGFGFWFLGNLSHEKKLRLILLICLLAIIILSGIIRIENYMTTPVDRQTAVALTKNSVGLEGVASFNSAIYGWLSKGKIRNIDGLANQDVWFALKRKTFGEYLQKEDIHYILDLYSTREGAMEQSESYINGNSQTIRVRLHPVVTLPDRGGWTHILSRIEYFTQENR